MNGNTFFEITTVVASVDPPNGNLAPSLVRAPNDDLLAVWSANDYIDGSLEKDPENVLDILRHPGSIKGSISTDHGATWSEPFIVAEGADGDPTLLAVDDRIVIRYTEVPYIKKGKDVLYQGVPKFYEKVSTDNGRSFGPAKAKNFGPKYWASRSNSIVLRSGTVVCPFYYVENVATEVLEKDMRCVSGALISGDGGETWTRGDEIRIDLPAGADEPTIAELSNGDLYMLIRTRGGAQYETRSSDQGRSWSKPQSSVLTSPSAPATLFRLSFEPNLVAVSWNNSSSNRWPLDFALSYDDCKTWKCSRTLVNPGRQVAYPTIAQAADGTIVVMYHESPDKNKVKWYYMRHIMAARFSEDWVKL